MVRTMMPMLTARPHAGKSVTIHRERPTLNNGTSERPYVTAANGPFITLVRNQIVPRERMKTAAMRIESSWET